MSIDTFLDYIRMVSYAVIIIASLNGIAVRKFKSILYAGDVVMAFALLVAAFRVTFGNMSGAIVSDFILTPGAIIWATIHFICMLDYNNNKLRGKKH